MRRVCEVLLARMLVLAFAVALAAAPAHAQLVDAFDDATIWTAVPASGVAMTIATDTGRAGKVMRVDFDFQGGGGWAAFRRELPLMLPGNYEISFWLKGDAPLNTLEFKLVDASGENVWWVNRPEFEYRGDWRRVTFRKRHITFAWGPRGGGDLTEAAAIEFAITAGTGGKGTIWLDDLMLTPRPPVRPSAGPPLVTRTRTMYTLDLREVQEYGGVIVEWMAPGNSRVYDVQISEDAQSWQTVRRLRGGRRAKDLLQMPETESRYLRIVVLTNDSAASIKNAQIAPLEWGASRNRLYEQLAAESGDDAYPYYFRNAQTYWTVVGNPGAQREALLNEYGALEVDKRSFTLEPFLHDNGQLIGWSAAHTTELKHDYLPIPSVLWQRDAVQVRTTTWTDADALWVRYRITNRTPQPRKSTLYVALRPFQVNPPTQFLNTPGGASRTARMSFEGGRIRVDGSTVVPVTPPAAFGAATFDEGDITDYLRGNTLPRAQAVTDSAESLASGALAYPIELEAHGVKDVYIAVPFDASGPVPADPEASLAGAIAGWRNELDRFDVRIPAAPDIGHSLRSNLAYILINQDGAAIQPGSRSYERSWIRDGALTSAALLRLGHAEEVRKFIEWYAPFQYADGKVPCCVDHRGADPVPENDSHGQLIYLIAEYFRYTGDTATVRSTWHHVERAVAYMDSLRQSRRTPEFRGTGFWGMLPQSISHEGYSAKPMHSYWDDFFALKGFKDAVWLAERFGRIQQARSWARMRDEFSSDLMDSFRATMQQQGIDYLAGSVELGDFDATSTTVGLTPAGAQHDLPQAPMRRTFEKYWQHFVQRRENWDAFRTRPDTSAEWSGYTPYEWRVVGALVRLGEKTRAHEVAEWFMDHRRPRAWNHWAEVVHRDARQARFIGDMPHTWVGSDFIRSVLDMFVYDDAGRLVIGAGIAPAWVASTRDTTIISGIRTPYGEISYRLFRTNETDDVVFLFDTAPAPPANGFVVRSVYDRPIRGARADGRAVPHTPGEVILGTLPQSLVLSY